MIWADLSNDAKSILEWTEHVISGNKQTLTIERGKTFFQKSAFIGNVEVPVTDQLFEEITKYLPHSKELEYTRSGEVLTVKLK